MIYYSNPWSSSKNMGAAINDFCRIIPNKTDWIVIQDGDICYLTPDWGAKIEEALQMDGDKFGLVGCYTNRLAAKTQLHLHRFSDNLNIAHHYNIAKTYTAKGIEPLQLEENIAGLFMAFQKQTWEDVGGFRENTPCFDTFFARSVKAKGYKIGLIRSLYVFHAYRPWSRTPKSDNGHLYNKASDKNKQPCTIAGVSNSAVLEKHCPQGHGEMKKSSGTWWCLLCQKYYP